MRINMIRIFYAFLLASLAGCVPVVMQVKGGQVQKLSSVGPNEVVLVGSVEVLPTIKDSERNFSKIKNQAFVDGHKKIFWLVKGKKWLKVSDFDIYNGATGGMSTDFTHHTPVPINGDQFAVTSDRVNNLYISGGYFPVTTRKVTEVTKYVGSNNPIYSPNLNTQHEYEMVSKQMNFKLKVHLASKAKAIYIGDIKIYRDKHFNLRKIVVIDNYKRANMKFKQQFKTKENLVKSLARK